MDFLSTAPSFAVPTFAGNTSPQQFLEYLRILKSQHLNDEGTEKTPASESDWSTIIVGLTHHFLASFPLPVGAVWSKILEKATITEASLEVMQRIFQRVEGIYNGSEELMMKIFVRLLSLCRVLDLWIETDDFHDDVATTPKKLKDNAFRVLIDVLRGLSNRIIINSEQTLPSLRTLHAIITECLDVSHDLISLSIPISYPATISFFNKPRFLDVNSDNLFESNPLHLEIMTASQVPAFLALVLDVLINALYPPHHSGRLMVDLERRVTEAIRSTFTYVLSPLCLATAATRAKVSIRIITSMIPMYELGFQGLLSYIPYSLLQYRMDQGPQPGWDASDSAFTKLIEGHKDTFFVLTADIMAILQSLRTENWGSDGHQLRTLAMTYLRIGVNSSDVNALKTIKNGISSLGPEFAAFVAQVNERFKILSDSNGVEANNAVDDAMDVEPFIWRQQVRALINSLLTPDKVAWMNDDSNENQLVSRALNEIRERFGRTHIHGPTTIRSSLAKKLQELICLLAHCNGSDCKIHSDLKRPGIISGVLSLVSRLLEGSADEVTNITRGDVYSTLTHIIQHHDIRRDSEGVEPLSEIIFQGIKDNDRGVRLRAGGALTVLIQTHVAQSRNASKYTELMFSRLYGCLDTEKNYIRETLIISIGNIGKQANPDTLGQVICLLVAQLGRMNPVVKGTAYMQIMALSKQHKKSPYTLILPYMDQVAPFLVSRMCTHPSFLTETSNLFCVSPEELIASTLDRTLPSLYAGSEHKVIEAISKLLSIKSSSLMLQYLDKILAAIFLLPRQTEITKALNYIIKTLREETGQPDLDVQSILKMRMVLVLVELVIVMGDENQEVVERGAAALARVQRTLESSEGRQATQLNQGVFLETYMLGLITTINDLLQDVRGKKSVKAKRQILRSLGFLIKRIGPAISSVAPQIMATFQTMLGIPDLSEVTLDGWYIFLTSLKPQDVYQHVGPTSAAFVSSWSTFSAYARSVATKSLRYVVSDIVGDMDRNLDDLVDLSGISELRHVYQRLKALRDKWEPKAMLQRILERSSSDNLTVAAQSLKELKKFMSTEHKDYVMGLASGDMFDPIVGQILSALCASACRDGDDTENIKLLAFECLGVLGAVDPDRCEIHIADPDMVVLNNFSEETEAVSFALHLIRNLLVGAFRSTSDIKYQGHLAYSIQELLKFCRFTPALVAAEGTASVPMRVRNRWNSLPKHVIETVAPLLEARLSLGTFPSLDLQHPIYLNHSTYREWIQTWTSYLITKASGSLARNIFNVFRLAVRNKDVVVAHHLLPHLVLNILISGNIGDAQGIRSELLAVLEDQVDNNSNSTSDKKLLSAQAVFMLLDHLNKWIRLARQDVSKKKGDSKRSRSGQIGSELEDQLVRVDSIISSIDHHLMARAAFQCKAFARSLMNFERQILNLQETSSDAPDIPGYYEKLHEIYAHIDEPDGMEGVSTLILSPSLEHQIRQHESTGRWTAAQSCWEVRLQQAPDNVDFHLGLLRCLRNLGHYDTLRTHVRGVLTRHPEWEIALAGFQVESAWMVGAWDDVQTLVQNVQTQSSSVVIARLLLAMRAGDPDFISQALSVARSVLGAPIAAAGPNGYRRSYDAILDLHLTHELEIIHSALTKISGSQIGSQLRSKILDDLTRTLSVRLDATFPTFRSREPILSMRRTAFALMSTLPRIDFSSYIGGFWLESAKIARKARQWQTAYSAMLQSQQSKSRFAFMESAKLVKATGEPLQALKELENAMKMLNLLVNPDVIDLTIDGDTMKMIAKAQVLRARWMNESDRFEVNPIFNAFVHATKLQKEWESAHFYLGQFHDECFKSLPRGDQAKRGMKMNLFTVRSFAKAIKFGSKFVYQTVPRLLTIWLDIGEAAIDKDDVEKNPPIKDIFDKLNEVVGSAIKEVPAYKWFTAFPQIVSRVGHLNPTVYTMISKLIVKVMEEYPKQSLWLFTSVVKSTKSTRASRGQKIIEQLSNNPSNARSQVQTLVQQCIAMTNELLALCDYHIDDNKSVLSMKKCFPRLAALGKSDLIIPLQESLTASLPSTSSSESTYQPFPPNAPTFSEFFDEIEVMRSLAKPRKVTIRGSNGQVYMFLGKPKDDLRKDARLMDFNSIINKLLKANSESRRRQLHIRTYGVVTLNEECGFIQWVPNTIPIRPVLLKNYETRRIKSWSPEMSEVFRKIKDAKDKDAGDIFIKHILPMFPPVFHEWFIETFPEPSAWLTSRLSYGRTAAVMSMVGFILGLGDRHCENILLDTNTGDVVHVDFNCLFEKGKTLETPERVPFRLTQNLTDGLGVSGVEGVFRIACEVTLQLLRDNKDSLMSVLDAFIHDPLVEWEDEKRKMERDTSRTRNQVKASVDLKMLAKNALNPIEKKLKGIYVTSKESQEKEVTTSNLVQMLIQEATNPANLAKMYPGWAAWH